MIYNSIFKLSPILPSSLAPSLECKGLHSMQTQGKVMDRVNANAKCTTKPQRVLKN